VIVTEALDEAEQRLAAAGVDTPRVDAEWLVAHVLGVSRPELYADPQRDVDETLLEPLLERRRKREPLAYVIGEWDFRKLTLKTDVRALVPRPETEIVVERCLTLLRDLESPRVLDIGAGTGAIALAIAAEHPSARVTAVDSSPDALALARENADRLRLSLDIHAGGIEAAAEGWDLVVSNPPYVTPEEWDALQPEIREWEPRAALVGEGLHEEIARRARTRLLVLEVGDGQARRVAESLRSLGYRGITISCDLAGRERVVEGAGNERS
jgi:release factor glutamine methyltransferase